MVCDKDVSVQLGHTLPTKTRSPRAILPWILAAALVALGGAWVVLRPRRAIVTGTSMVPTLLPGDRVLLRSVREKDLQVGRIVAVRDPRDARRVLIKRIARVGVGPTWLLHVAGDNPLASTDSRDFGAVGADRLVGVAMLRYAPKERWGLLGEGPAETAGRVLS